jgi:hypothetical protein
MIISNIIDEDVRRVLNPVDRILEIFFGLFMALAFIGSISVATTGREEVRTLLAAALGCNLAWGLVDASMYLVETITARGRTRSLVIAVRRAPDADLGRRVVERSILSAAAGLITQSETETIRARIVALPSLPEPPSLRWDDLLAAVAIFLLVVGATLPVALPFVLIADVRLAMTASRITALAMMFVGGVSLGRYAGYGGWKVGLLMMGLGAGLVLIIMALGG